MSDDIEIGERIREERDARGWTNLELAAELGVYWRTVQRWMAGELPPLHRLLDVADVLGIPREELVGTRGLQLEERVERLEELVDELLSERNGRVRRRRHN